MAPAGATLDDEPRWRHDRDGATIRVHDLPGLGLVYVSEPMDREARANVIFSHGFTDHAARHVHAHVRLAAAGYRVLTFDLAGHGGRGDEADCWWAQLPYLTCEDAASTRLELERGLQTRPRFRGELAARQFRRLAAIRFPQHVAEIQDLGRRLRGSRRYEPGLPLVLFGHSMGALICVEASRSWSESTGQSLAGIALTSPAFTPGGSPTHFQMAFVDAIWKLRRLPWWGLPFSLVRPGLKRLMRLNLPVDTTWAVPSLSDRAIEGQLYTTDPLTPTRVPSSYVSSTEDQMVMTDQAPAALGPPTLVLLPHHDGIAGVDGGLAFARRARAESTAEDHVQLTRIEHVHAHDLTRSTAAARAHEALVAWLGTVPA